MRAVLLILFLTAGYMIACQPSTRARMAQKAEVDSSLYFTQKDIDDPFLDRLLEGGQSVFSLRKTLYPPPQPEPAPPAYKEVEGFRVRLLAGIDSLNAHVAVAQARSFIPDTLYLFFEKGLFKVQAGDFQFRPGADAAKTKLRQNGFPGAWVLRRQIRIPLAQDSSGTQTKIVTGTYRIQVMATASKLKAEESVARLNKNAGLSSFYEESGNLFKVYVGLFDSEATARQVLEQIRDLGYADAWLVY